MSATHTEMLYAIGAGDQVVAVDAFSNYPADVPVTPEQRAELDRRLDDLDRDIQNGSELGVPWDEVLRQIRARS